MNKMALALAVAVLASLGGIALGGKEYASRATASGKFRGLRERLFGEALF